VHIVLPTGLYKAKHKAPGQVLTIGTAQQYTKVSTLLWVKRLAQSCAHVCNQAVMHMSKADVQC